MSITTDSKVHPEIMERLYDKYYAHEEKRWKGILNRIKRQDLSEKYEWYGAMLYNSSGVELRTKQTRWWQVFGRKKEMRELRNKVNEHEWIIGCYKQSLIGLTKDSSEQEDKIRKLEQKVHLLEQQYKLAEREFKKDIELIRAKGSARFHETYVNETDYDTVKKLTADGFRRGDYLKERECYIWLKD